MKKIETKKLNLNKKTVTTLDAKNMNNVNGGDQGIIIVFGAAAQTIMTCPPGC